MSARPVVPAAEAAASEARAKASAEGGAEAARGKARGAALVQLGCVGSAAHPTEPLAAAAAQHVTAAAATPPPSAAPRAAANGKRGEGHRVGECPAWLFKAEQVMKEQVGGAAAFTFARDE